MPLPQLADSEPSGLNIRMRASAISDGKTDDLTFYAFDLLFAEKEDLRGLPLSERKARLKQLLETC